MIVECCLYEELDVHQEDTPQPVALGHSLAAHPERAPVGGARRDAKLDRWTAQRRNLDLRTESRLGEGDWSGQRQVVTLASEDRMRANVHRDVEITGRTAVLAGTALALQPDPLIVGDPGRNPDLHGPG